MATKTDIERIDEKLQSLKLLASDYGWTCQIEPTGAVEGCRCPMMLVGAKEIDGVEYGFGIAYAVKVSSNRVVALQYDGRSGAYLNVMRSDQFNTTWSSAVNTFETMLEDPVEWTGG